METSLTRASFLTTIRNIILAGLTIFLLCSCDQLAQKETYRVSGIQIVSKTIYYTNMGSGFFINYENRIYLVTATHVVQNKTALCLFDGKGNPTPIDNYEPIHLGDSDISIFYIKRPPRNIFTYKIRTTELSKGEPLFSYGYVDGDKVPRCVRRNGIYLTDYIVRSESLEFVTSTCDIEVGMSGGPVVDLSGNVVGVTSAYIDNCGIKRAFAAPISVVKTHLDLFF